MERVGDYICMGVPVCKMAAAFCANAAPDGRQAVCQALQRACPDQLHAYEPSFPCYNEDNEEYAPFVEKLYDKSLLGNNDWGGLGLSIYGGTRDGERGGAISR